MVTKEKIDRINFLAKKSKNEGLSEKEKQEQKALREEYLDNLRKTVRGHLDNIEIVDDESK